MTEAPGGVPPAAQPGPARLAVLGSPIAHSRSPRIHRAAYAVLGLPWEYAAVECAEDALPSWLDARGPEWRGLSLTMPLKHEARRLATVLDPVAEESGVVNTLLRLAGTGTAPRWAGFNTDVGGLAAAIARHGLDAADTVVLGAGATAVSAVLAARRLGAVRVTVLARRSEAAAELARRFDGTSEARPTRDPGPDAMPGSSTAAALAASSGVLGAGSREAIRSASLVISTLPGSAGRSADLPDGIAAAPLFDVAYDPWPSPLAERWRASGGDAHSGLGMLVEQALLQIRVFVGGDPAAALPDEDAVLAAMRAAAEG